MSKNIEIVFDKESAEYTKSLVYEAAFWELCPKARDPEWTQGQEDWAHDTAVKISEDLYRRLDVNE